MNLNEKKDLNYYWIIKKGNRTKMYHYRLIRAIIENLDKYLEENNIETISNESELLYMIDRLYKQHSQSLTRYFSLFSPPGFNKPITLNDIESWTFKYKKKNKLYFENGVWSYGI